jgi:hypothetical protein
MVLFTTSFIAVLSSFFILATSQQTHNKSGNIFLSLKFHCRAHHWN